MIARLIEWCIQNRMMVLLLTALLAAGGVWSAFNITVDAIPDLSDVQVVIRTEYPGQAPRIVEDQVTYPLTTALLAVPHAKVVRGYSMVGTSFVYVIFEDGTDIYWARSRVLEQLSTISSRLPTGVSPQLGPDATGVGWIYQYVLITGPYCPTHPNGLWHDPLTDVWYASTEEATRDDQLRARLVHHRIFPREAGFETCPLDGSPLMQPEATLAELRSLQDWYLRYELTPVAGVSEVASLGGMVKQYQVTVDPVRLLAYGLPVGKVRAAIARSNSDIGGRVMELSETEFMVRSRGYLGTLEQEELDTAVAQGLNIGQLRTRGVVEDLGNIALGVSAQGGPIYLRDIATITTGPEIRRGILEWNGQGEAVGGIVVMRFGENASETIEHVRDKLAALSSGLPPGVAIVTGYDRSDLIDRAVGTLSHTLVVEILVVSLVCILFLLHARSELVAVTVVPLGVLCSITTMHLLGFNANIMSLGGIAIAIGVMVDSSIVMVENSHKHLDRHDDEARSAAAEGRPWEPPSRSSIICDAAKEVGPSLFFALLIITVSFLPVFVLGDQSGRLFRPLAFTKTFAMAWSALLAVTVIPVLMTLFITSRVLPRQWGMLRNTAITLGAMFIPAAILLITPLGPLEPWRWWLAGGLALVVGMLLVPQKIVHEHHNPISWVLQAIYEPFFRFSMQYRWLVMTLALLLTLSAALPLWGLKAMPGGDWLSHRVPALANAFPGLGSEFMPPLEEGDLLYMPTTDHGLSITKAREILQQTDAIIRQFPEVQSVMGKIGRAETATDPAPLSMVETTITLHRDKSKWRHVPIERFYHDWPRWLAWLPSKAFDGLRPISVNELIYGYEVHGVGFGGTALRVPGLNDALQIPGLANAWTMPIKTRIDMLSTGIKTPVGVKVMGPDLDILARVSQDIEQLLRSDARTAPFTASAYAEKSTGGNYMDINIQRDQIARYGLTIGEVQDVIATALGGMNVTHTVEGLERYPVNLRYPRELRDDVESLKQVMVPVTMPVATQVPLGQLATIERHKGAPMIKSENARLTAWVYVDITDIDVGTYVATARKVVDEKILPDMPEGYNIIWSGQYEYMQAARARLMVIVPVTLVIIVMLLYLATHSWLRVGIVLLAVPFSLIGAVWFLYVLDYNLSLAVWVGIIALAGLDAETGLVMLLYLDNSYERFNKRGHMRNRNDLWHAIHEGAVKRIRPKTMTVMTTFIALIPLMWASGAGADTMRRLAAPMIGGLATSFVMELLLYPVIFYSLKSLSLKRQQVASVN